MPGDNGLSDLLAAVGLANKDLVSNSAAAKSILEDQQQASQEEQNAVQRQADDTGIVTQAKDLAEKNAQAKNLQAATDLGTNPDGAGYVLNTLSQSLRQSALDADAKQSKLEHDLSISFFDHPIDYVAAQINMDKTVAQADAAISHRDSTAHALAELHQNTQSAAVTNNVLKQTVTNATIEADVDSIQAQAAEKKAQLRIQNGGIQVQGLRELGQMDLQQVNNLSIGVTGRNQADDAARADAHLKLAQQNADLALKEYNDKVAEKKATLQDTKDIADTVRTGAAAAGYTNISAIPDRKIISMLNMKDDNFMSFLKAGMKSQALGRPIVSENAGESAQMIGKNGAPLAATQDTVKKLFVNSWDHAKSPQGGQQGRYDISKPDQVTTAAGRFAVDSATKMAANIDPKDGTNIYAAPPLASVVQAPSIQNSTWYKKVLAPHMATGELKEFNSEQLGGLTAAAIQSGQISFKDAADGFQAMHTVAVRANNATKNFEGFGLPKQSSFILKLPTPMGALRSYDMSTPQGVQNYLSTKLRSVGMQDAISSNPFSIN